MYGVLCASPGHQRVSWISFARQPRRRSATLIFRLPLRYDTPWPVSLLVVVALVVVLRSSVLERRVRGVEVVA